MYKTETDVFKRISMFNSTKRASANDPTLNADLQKHNVIRVKDGRKTIRVLEDEEIEQFLAGTLEDPDTGFYEVGYSFRSDRKQYTGNIKTLIFRDNELVSKYVNNNVRIVKYKDGKISYFDENNNEIKNSDAGIITRTFAEDFVKDGITNNDLLTAKVNAYLKPYREIEEGDGQGYITLDEYKEVLLRSGLLWTPQHERVYVKALKGERLTQDELIVFAPLKTQYTGPMMGPDKESGNKRLFVPVGYKHSLAPLIPSMIKGTQLEKLNNHMKENQIGIAQYATATKFGIKLNNGKLQDFYAGDGSLNVSGWDVTQDVSYDYFGVQLEIQPKTKNKITSATQPTKLVLSNAFENGKIREGFKKTDIVGYKELTSELTRRSMSKLLKEIDADPKTLKIKNINKLVNVLLEEAKDRGVPDNVRKSLRFLALDLVRTSGVKGAYIEEVLTRTKVENILNAVVNARVIRQKRYGEGFCANGI
jgi:hypothetical protein